MNVPRLAGLLLVAYSPLLWADGQTLSGTFLGTEPTMVAEPTVFCDGSAKPYKEFATVQVTVAGEYYLYDAGNSAYIFGQNAEVADVVILIYQGSFNPANPAQNRVDLIDEGGEVQLNTGTDYILVAQYWCGRSSYGIAPFGLVTFGPGNFTGAGFNTASSTLGFFTGASPVTAFPDLSAVLAYKAISGITVPRTGRYFFSDIARLSESAVQLRVYEGAFDPDNPEDNLVGTASFSGPLFLESGQLYVFVVVDIDNQLSAWHYALFPPGPVGFHAGFNGAWVPPVGISGQGILAELLEQAGIMFFAWFTYWDSPPVLTQTNSIDNDEGVTRKQTHLGEEEQRWMTAYGAIPASGNTLSLKYENSTGGAFNSTGTVPNTDSNYGTGSVTLIDCLTMDLTYDLPGGVGGTTRFTRILPDNAMRCYDITPFGPIQPPLF